MDRILHLGELGHFKEMLGTASPAVDIETGPTEKGYAVLGVGFGYPFSAGFVDLQTAFRLAQSIPPDTPRIFHNAKFDIKGLGVGNPLFRPLDDSMIAAHLLQYQGVGLSYLASWVLDQKLEDYKEVLARHSAVDLAGVPYEAMAQYCMDQVVATSRLMEEFAVGMRKEGLLKAYELELKIIPILAQMELDGVRVDREFLQSTQEGYSVQEMAIRKAIRDLSGDKLQNPNSHPQLREYLYKVLKLPVKGRTRKGRKPSTDDRALEKIKHLHPIVRLVQLMRQTAKNTDACVEILEKLDTDDRSRTNYSQVSVETGRLSSKNPSHHTVPKRRVSSKPIRKAFVAKEGCMLLVADKDQIELRIITEDSQDKRFLEVFNSGEDAHLATCMDVFGDSSRRFYGKMLNYSVVYGSGPGQVADQSKVGYAVGQRWLNKFFSVHKKLKQYSYDLAARAKEEGFVRTRLGRKRNMELFFRVSESDGRRKAVNTVTQGTAAEVIKEEMVRMQEYIEREGLETRMILQIHDELIFEVPHRELGEMKRAVGELMVTTYGRMRLPVTIKVGRSWGEAT